MSTTIEPVAEAALRRVSKKDGEVAVSRTKAAKTDFTEGDYVVYPTHGVGLVERIAVQEIAGHTLDPMVKSLTRKA